MILDLTLNAAREQAKATARAQGTFTIPVRTGTDSTTAAVSLWPLDDVLAHLDRVERIERHGSSIVTQLRGDYTRSFWLPQPMAQRDETPASVNRAGAVWEVTSATGEVMYRGADVELAHEVASSEPNAHFVAPAVTA